MYEEIFAIFVKLAGLGGLISVIVSMLKLIGVAHDGTSDKWIQGLNLLAFAVVAILYFVNLPVDWLEVDSWMTFAVGVLGFVIQLFGSKSFYAVAKGIPIVGYSYDNK